LEISGDGLGELGAQVRDALALAIASGAPLPLLEKLGAAVGLLQALAELPAHALIPQAVTRAHRALTAWQQWHKAAQRGAAA
jgi:hypothetical protein